MNFKNLVLLQLALIHSSFCTAELRDPTKPAFYNVTTMSEESQAGGLKLSSIWISGHSKRATINGVTAREGENIFSDIRIIKILNGSVLIEQNGVTKKLTLLTRSYKTR